MTAGVIILAELNGFKGALMGFVAALKDNTSTNAERSRT
jgi:hypothetical protein